MKANTNKVIPMTDEQKEEMLAKRAEEKRVYLEKFEIILDDVKADIATGQKLIQDLEARYDPNGPIDEVIKIQGAILNYRNWLSQKRVNYAELERQYLETLNDE